MNYLYANVCIEREFSRFQTNKILHLNNSFVDMNKYTNVCLLILLKRNYIMIIQNNLDFVSTPMIVLLK